MTSLNLELSANTFEQSGPAGTATLAPVGKSAPPKLPAIQMLRGFAAALVVFHHTSGIVASRNIHPSWFIQSRLPVLGAAGVDIFFVISGFIMFYTTTRKTGRSDAETFLWKRTLRIYPLYWLWTTALVLVAASKLIPVNHSHDIYYFVSSYLLIPAYSGYNYHPFLDQGWTLSFEMLFYLIFSLGLWLKRRDSILTFLCASFAALLLASLLLPLGSGIKYLFSNTLILEFLFGVGLAKLLLRRNHDTSRKPMRLGVSAAIIAIGSTLLLSTSFLPQGDAWLIAGPWRFLYWGIPSALIVFGFASWNQKLTSSAFVYLGDASYTTYLAHVFFLRALLVALNHSAALRSLPVDAEMLTGAILIILLTLVPYQWIERPLTSLLAVAPKRRRALVLPSRA